MLHELIYVSLATRPMTAEDVQDILETSRRNNEARGITGILLYSGRTQEFMQLLEGDHRTLDELTQVISDDDRHDRMEVIYRGGIEHRSFENWSMAFRDLAELDPNGLEGYSTFFTDGFMKSLGSGPTNIARSMLEHIGHQL